jgi:hypothetical protein
MPSYAMLQELVRNAEAEPEERRWHGVVRYLIDQWLTDYGASTPAADVVETGVSGFSYLFDVRAERLVSAWGISNGKHGAERDKSRMRGHPLSAGPHYHRGHAIAHSLGGTTDINLVPQLGRINTGDFRKLENEAVASPGSLYFTYWLYDPARRPASAAAPVPRRVEQGLLIAGRPPRIRSHVN